MDNIIVRKPAVAGKFYPGSPNEIKKQIRGFLDDKISKSEAIACILPHAGYIYSGKVACQTIASINLKNKLVILGPNHTGIGKQFSIICQGTWQTPLGDIKIDGSLAKNILNQSEYLEEDNLAHLYEHSIEVELPILQYFKPDFQIVPIVCFPGQLQKLKKIGQDIARAIIDSGLKDSVTLIASSDMTHYEPYKQAQKKDNNAIQSILELDESGLERKIKEENITMCGWVPVVITLCAAKLLGAKTARLINYQTSGDVTGEMDSVVGYAGIVIS
ncbi:MAG: AmmeMemoRadiSam system protein B [Candidatus Omnitrophota bacterium]